VIAETLLIIGSRCPAIHDCVLEARPRSCHVAAGQS
jgi:hypothetical protein